MWSGPVNKTNIKEKEPQVVTSKVASKTVFRWGSSAASCLGAGAKRTTNTSVSAAQGHGLKS